MDLKQIEKLMAAMEKSRMRRIALKTEGFEIELEREYGNFSEPSQTPVSPRPITEVPIERSHLSTPRVEEAAPATSSRFVTSPMVGTFYAAPSPEDPPFIKVGDAVSEESVVCIIEAMKVMNEVKAGIKGTVLEVLLKNGDPVEFGTKIFRISST